MFVLCVPYWVLRNRRGCFRFELGNTLNVSIFIVVYHTVYLYLYLLQFYRVFTSGRKTINAGVFCTGDYSTSSNVCVCTYIHLRLQKRVQLKEQIKQYL